METRLFKDSVNIRFLDCSVRGDSGTFYIVPGTEVPMIQEGRVKPCVLSDDVRSNP